MHWNKATGLRLPTILPATSICLLIGCETGFPSSVLIEPVMPWLVALADQVKRSSEKFTHVSMRMTTHFKTSNLIFVRPHGTFWYSYNYIGMEGRLWQWGWILQETKGIYDCLKKEDQDDLILRGPDGNYTGDVQPVIFTECYALLQQFNPREWAAKIDRIVMMQLLKFRPNNMIWTQILLLDVAIHFLVRGGFSQGRSGSYDLWTKEVVAVFNAIVHVWDPTAEEQVAAEAAASDSKSSRGSKSPFPPPPKSAQSSSDQETPLLQETTSVGRVTDGEDDPSPSEKKPDSPFVGLPVEPPSPEAKPLPELPAPEVKPLPPKAPEKKPADETDASPLDVGWDLAGSLRRQKDLFSELGEEQREAKVQKLASLLQLRALFVIALFLLSPDSSDVYLADGERVEMPMV